MLRAKKLLASLFATGLMSVGLAAPAAAHPLVTGGLVNITVVTGDIVTVEEVNLGVALNTAANICEVNVNVLAVQLRDGGATCSTGAQTVTISQTT